MFEFQELTKPALFTLFGRDVTAYALFLTLGVLIGVLMSINRAKRTHYDVNAALLFPVLAIPLSVIFGRLVYCLCSIVLLLDNGFGFIFRIDYGGFSIMGVTIGLALAALLTAHQPRAKKDGPAWLPGVVEPGPRRNERAAPWALIPLDIEQKGNGPQPPALCDVAAAAELWGGVPQL